MFLIEFEDLFMLSRERLTDEEITDLIEVVVDDLDRSGVEPSVSTTREGDGICLGISLHIDENDEFDAWASALLLVKAALHAAGIGTAAFLAPPALRARATLVQPA